MRMVDKCCFMAILINIILFFPHISAFASVSPRFNVRVGCLKVIFANLKFAFKRICNQAHSHTLQQQAPNYIVINKPNGCIA